MTRGLRCVVQVVYAVEGAAAFYMRAGFLVGPQTQLGDFLAYRDIHLPGFYLSLISPPSPPDTVLELLDPGLSHGFTTVVLEDSVAHATWPRGIPGVATGSPPLLEHVADQSLEQHPNTVFAIAGVVIVAKNPSDHHIFLSEFTQQRELRATSAGVTAPTSRGELSIVDRTAFRGLYGTEPPELVEVARIAAVRLSTRNLGTLAEKLRLGAVPYITHMSRIVIEPATAMGGALVFEPDVDHVIP